MPVVESPFEEVGPDFRPVRAWRAQDEDEVEKEPRRPLDRRKLARVLLIIAAAAVLLLAVWWVLKPRSYHLVGRYPSMDAAILPCATGFLLRESAGAFVLRDWGDGHERWRIAINTTRSVIFSISPSGHYCAALFGDVSSRNIRLQVWQDGLLMDSYPMPRDTPRIHLKALDDGRVFVWPSFHNRVQAMLLQGGKVIARGQLLDGIVSGISPDGNVIASPRGNGFEYGTVTVRDGVISVSHQYAGQEDLEMTIMDGFDIDACLCANGMLLTRQGAIYGASGRVSSAGRWQHVSVSPCGRYAYECQREFGCVFSPVTGERWSFRVPGMNKGGDATNDGRYALAWYSADVSGGSLFSLRDIPLLGALVRYLPRPNDYLALYERPGRLCAVLRMNIQRWWGSSSPPFEWWWYPSPDGRTVALAIAGQTGGKCLLFRR